MFFYNARLLAGAAVSLITCLATADPGLARPLDSQTPEIPLSQLNSQPTNIPSEQPEQPEQPNQYVSQINRSPEQGVPPLLTQVVRGRITDINGSWITVEDEDGEERSYLIPTQNENRDGLEVGAEIVLRVERGYVISYNISAPVQESTSTAVIRRQAPVETARPAPPPAPAPRPVPPPPAPRPAAQPAPQPVRGMW